MKLRNVKDPVDAEINSLLDIPIQQEKPHIQSHPTLFVSVLVIPEPSVLKPIPKTPSVAPVTSLPHPYVSIIPHDVPELKKIDHSTEALATLKTQVPMTIDNYLGSKLGDAFQKVLHKQSADFAQEFSVKPAPESSKIQISTINLEQNSKKSVSKIRKIKKEQALIEDENAMDKGVANKVKNHKRQHNDDDDDDKDPLAGPDQDKLDWNNLEGDRYPFDMSKPLPLQGRPGYLTVAAYYFFNNDMEFLKTFDPEKTYIMSITKTKAASVKKLHGYGHLEEIVVKRADRQLYKFKECNFVDLHLNDTKDMILLFVQHKLFHLNNNDIVDFIVNLCMFTRSLIIKKHVKDLHLGVERY
nr:hypothetical protein [Tanacetum cinerariifolium]